MLAPTGGRSSTALATRLRATRRRAFVGRAAEVNLFLRALQGTESSYAVLFLHGPGGVGKSTLLRRFADEAAAAGRTVVEFDGRYCAATPMAFEHEAAGALGGKQVVLLIDTFEKLQQLEGWLWNRFLPCLPDDTLVVIAGRQPPDPLWRTDPAWWDTLRVVAVGDLPREDAQALLAARGVPAARQASLLDRVGGHALALTMAADADRQDRDPSAVRPVDQDATGALLSRLVGEVPSPTHRRALEICAHVNLATEELLRAALPGCDAGALFEWLRRLPFMEASAAGICPHEVVRDALDRDWRWRDPQCYRDMHHRILSHVVERVRTAPEFEVLAVAATLPHLQRGIGAKPRWFDGPSRFGGWQCEAYEDAFRPGDQCDILRLAAEDAGAEVVPVVEFWLTTRPNSCYVYRSSTTNEIVGFLLWLRLTAPDDAELAADPVVLTAWQHAGSVAPLREGEHLAMARLMVAAEPGPSPAGNLVNLRILAEMLRAERVAWTYVALPDREQSARMRFFAEHLRPSAVRLPARDADHGYSLIAEDRRAASTETWLEILGFGASPGDRMAPDATQSELEVLSRPEFDVAVRQALRSWHRPDELAGNPLLRSRLVADSGPANPPEVLRGVLAAAVAQLADDPGTRKPYHAVTVTYLRGSPTQEAAAQRLGLPFSTYRRHLARGLERLSDLLWHRELTGVDAAEPASALYRVGEAPPERAPTTAPAPAACSKVAC